MNLFPEDIYIKEPATAAKYFEQSIEGFFKVFNASPGGMCIAENSVLLEMNTVYVEFFGFSREEAIGRTNEELGILDAQELQSMRRVVKEKGALTNHETRCKNKAGETVYCLVTTLPVVLSDRQMTLASFTDITHLKEQASLIAEQHQDIFDSINYAKRIQETLFVPKSFVENILPHSFVLLKPKAIVTGDFYWIEKKENKIYLAAADCTGKGVLGALMSIIGHNLISKSLGEKNLKRPCDILNNFSEELYNALRQNTTGNGVKDGMDISLICLDMENKVMEYASARQPVYRIRNNELLQLTPDRFPIGIYTGQYLQKFNNQQIPIQRGDTIYMFTDGYINQFGGPEKKRFKSMQFKKLLLSIQSFSMKEQKMILQKELEEWQNECGQVDDIMVIGIRI